MPRTRGRSHAASACGADVPARVTGRVRAQGNVPSHEYPDGFERLSRCPREGVVVGARGYRDRCARAAQCLLEGIRVGARGPSATRARVARWVREGSPVPSRGCPGGCARAARCPCEGSDACVRGCPRTWQRAGRWTLSRAGQPRVRPPLDAMKPRRSRTCLRHRVLARDPRWIRLAIRACPCPEHTDPACPSGWAGTASGWLPIPR